LNFLFDNSGPHFPISNIKNPYLPKILSPFTNSSQSVDKNDSLPIQPPPKASKPKRRPSSPNDFEGSGLEELNAEGFTASREPVLIGDDESLLNELVEVETRRKPAKKAKKPAKLEYEVVVEGSGLSG
jgi:hypothetical protein